MGIKAPVTGGWMKSSAMAISYLGKDIELAVATLYGTQYRKDIINGITYYCIPFNIYDLKYNKAVEEEWKRVAEDFVPDIVHIHGTEFPHGLAYMKANGTRNVVVSIQGLVGAYARYSLGGLTHNVLRKYSTLYDVLKGHILKMPERMERNGRCEMETISLAQHVIGRTDWDRVHVWAINPNTQYHFCNETLRTPFYSACWNLDECERHTIFLSQAHKPIKGIHKMVEAMPFILRHYPDTKVYVAGGDFMLKNTWKDRLKFDAYANYVSHLMDKLEVKNRFVFTGLLDENQMVQRFKKAHVFVCPSSIENSPNSLGEAQLVGTPCVASYVGGVPNMLTHEHTGLVYRFEEHEMLAAAVCRILGDDDLAKSLSDNERTIAGKRHDPQLNAQKTIEIYKSIIK